MGNDCIRQRKENHRNEIIYQVDSEKLHEQDLTNIAMPKLSQLYILRRERAKLLNSNTINFGNECIRLVNIVFHTSQIFPSIMGASDTISQYLRNELTQRHSSKRFHIIIGEVNQFSFAISDINHFAEIQYEQYLVLIFSTESRQGINIDKHDANSQVKLQWKSVLIKQVDG